MKSTQQGARTSFPTDIKNQRKWALILLLVGIAGCALLIPGLLGESPSRRWTIYAAGISIGATLLGFLGVTGLLRSIIHVEDAAAVKAFLLLGREMGAFRVPFNEIVEIEIIDDEDVKLVKENGETITLDNIGKERATRCAELIIQRVNSLA